MRLIRPFLPAKVHRRIARIVGRRSFLSFLRLKTLHAGPGVQQRAVHREVLVRSQTLGPGLRHRSEEHTSELQSLAYLVCRLLLEKKKKQRMSNQCENKNCTRTCGINHFIVAVIVTNNYESVVQRIALL